MSARVEGIAAGIVSLALIASAWLLPALIVPEVLANSTTRVPSADTLRRDWRSLLDGIDQRDVYSDYPHLECFRDASTKHDIPLPVLLGLAWGESNFDATAKSNKDAYGLMQIRWPLTAKSLGFQSIDELKQPCRNVDAGAGYLRHLLNGVDDDMVLALASYNHGPTAIGGRDRNMNDHARWYVRYIHDKTARVVARRRWSSPADPSLRLGRFTDYGMAAVALNRYRALAAHKEETELDLLVQRLDDGRFELRVQCDSVDQITEERRRYERLTGFVAR